MGQYHKQIAFNPETGFIGTFSHHELGCGSKAWEQLGGNCGNGLILMLSVNPGNGPADLSWAPHIGSWAGSRILCLGDYAEDDDIADWDGPHLTHLYGLADPDQSELQAEWPEHYSKNDIRRARWREYVTRARDHFRANARYGMPVDSTQSIRAALEASASVRFAEDGWAQEFRVAKKTSRGKTKWELQGADQYRQAPDPKLYNRPPAEPAPGDLTTEDLTIGQMRVILNLDKMEYLDPTDFGDIPTTAGMLAGNETADGLITSLYCSDSRGGGDFPDDSKLPEPARNWRGRWHGDRLVATATTSSTFLSTVEAKKKAKNVSQHAKTFLKSIEDM